VTIKVSNIGSAQAALNDALRDINVESELLLNVIITGIERYAKLYVPIGETSNLINSFYRTTMMTPIGPTGEVGFRADYAVYVHEGPQKNWQRPGASNRFLELGVRDYIQDDLQSDIARFQP